jgi:hypothetical protein
VETSRRAQPQRFRDGFFRKHAVKWARLIGERFL